MKTLYHELISVPASQILCATQAKITLFSNRADTFLLFFKIKISHAPTYHTT